MEERLNSSLLLITITFFSLFSELVWSQSRALLIVSELDQRGLKELRPLYKKIESLSWSIPTQSKKIKKNYREFYLLKDEKATSEEFGRLLIHFIGDPTISSVDVILGVHGRPQILSFFDGAISVTEWARSIKSKIENIYGVNYLNKFGLLYNLSCYGATHGQGFLDLGFKVVVGSRRVNANAEIEYPWVLNSLGKGYTVRQAFNQTNSSGWLNFADEPIRWIGNNKNNFLKDTDSYKEIFGDLDYRINEENIELN